MPSGAPGIKVSRLKDIEPISQRNSVISDREVIRCAEHGVRGVQTIVSTKQTARACERGAQNPLYNRGGRGRTKDCTEGIARFRPQLEPGPAASVMSKPAAIFATKWASRRNLVARPTL